MKIDPLNITFTPLPGSTFTNLVRLLAQNRFKIDVVGIPRMLYSVLMSIVLSPLNVYEKFRFHRRIQETQFKTPPLFIIGHWRSGTTYLHNLITQDTSSSAHYLEMRLKEPIAEEEPKKAISGSIRLTAFIIILCSLIFMYERYSEKSIENLSAANQEEAIEATPLREALLFDYPKSYETLKKIVN